MKSLMTLALFTILLRSVQAALPLDIVFDIDQTIVTLVHEGPRGDLLADPLSPEEGIISVTHGDPKKIHERYRVYQGLRELMTDLRVRQSLGQIRVSFFSGGSAERNKALLEAIKLSDGSSLLDLVSADGEARVYSRSHMSPTGKGPEARIRERFKKDLRTINPNLEDVILVDDIRDFVPDDQLHHVVNLGENFPYPERLYPEEPLKLTPGLLEKEKNKIYWLSDYLDRAIEKRLSGKKTLSEIITTMTKNNTTTPFSKNQEIHFQRGLDHIGDPQSVCSAGIRKALNHLLQSSP